MRFKRQQRPESLKTPRECRISPLPLQYARAESPFYNIPKTQSFLLMRAVRKQGGAKHQNLVFAVQVIFWGPRGACEHRGLKHPNIVFAVWVILRAQARSSYSYPQTYSKS